ncbi:MAG: imidazole glycerol phosphate synthase subunit HisH [Candidatus Omnitrophica bacterium]|nr:imidazole glycerol phosphate synthase subunit HisH [Candidatus Omnitrophota bacterium]MCM8831714.1 imidazole glycerol phosphate synthase subunit HisH [Candidatus Omnitrophota bacterium]
MIVIIDYGMGNLRSVKKAIEFLGKDAKVTDNSKFIKVAKKIILPGVGHFGKAVLELKRRKIFDVLIKKITEGIPFLGICLGMQIVFEKSQEAKNTKGLGLIKGEVRKFNLKNLIVPHMGWNNVSVIKKTKKTKIFEGIKNNSFFYFAHSYYCLPEEKDVIVAITDYKIKFCSVINKKNIWAVQFHPEKSQNVGLKLLKNFIDLC